MSAPGQKPSDSRQKSGLSERFSGAARSEVRKPPNSRPFSIRLTDGEREALAKAAGTKPIGAFVREQLLDGATRRKSTRRPGSDTAMLGQILATLGKSGLASGLADLGASARLGTIEITPEMEAHIRIACADIQNVKHMLVRGLGLADEATL